MSDQTKKAMDEAIEAHIADISEEHVRVVTGYALVVKSIDLADVARMSTYNRFTPDDQSFDTTIGLHHSAILALESYWRSTDE
jgi:hypothetical protein